MNDSAKNRRLQLLCTQVSSQALPIIELDGHERLGRPYQFDLLLQIPDTLEPKDLLNQPATLDIELVGDGEGDAPTSRRYHGIVTQVNYHQNASGAAMSWVRLQPRLSRLSLFTRTDIFTNEVSIPQLMAHLLTEAGLTTEDYELRLRGSYRSRSFVCQYRETTLDFIHRWMETLGLYYYFDQEGDHEKMIICDDNFFLPKVKQALRFRPAGGLDTHYDPGAVLALTVEGKLLPSNVHLQDYDYRRAQRGELVADHKIAGGQVGEVMLFGENLRAAPEQTADQIDERARLLAEAYACTAQRYHGEAAAPICTAGDLVELSQHPRATLNRDYRIIELQHHATQAGTLLEDPGEGEGARQDRYQLEWDAIDVALPFRLPRDTPRPLVSGTLTAVIDSDGSDPHAYINEYGQYKVSVPFDRTTKNPTRASTWIRMASPYAGMDHGMHFPLLKDTEVLLSFIDGDPDQPVISSCVPNSQNRSMVTQANPTQNIIHSQGGNQLLMEDAPGSQGVKLYSPTGDTSITLGATGASSDADSSATSSSTSASSPAAPSPAPAAPFGITLFSQKGMSVSVTAQEVVTLGNSMNSVVGARETMTLGAMMTVSVGVSAEYTLQKRMVFRESKATRCLTAARVQLEDQEETLKKTATYLNFDMTTLATQKVTATTATYEFGVWSATSTTSAGIEAPALSLKGVANATLEGGIVTVSATGDATLSALGSTTVSAVGSANLTADGAVEVTGATTVINGKATLGLAGATIDLTATTMLTVDAPIIQLG